MIICSLSEINDIKFEKVKNEYRYVKNLCNALVDFTDILHKNKEMLVELQAKESGKPVKYCRIEVDRCDDQLNQAIAYIQYKYLVDCTGIMRSIKYLPIGKVLAITTFSSPYSSFFHKILPAVICGNMFIFAPSPKVYNCSKVMFNMLEQCMSVYLDGIEKRIFCIDTMLINSSNIIEELKFDYILFTGKSETAASIKKQIGYRHGTFETGSNAMAYVDETIDDIDGLAERLVYAAFAQSGMRCIGLKNLFIQKSISKLLIERILVHTRKIQIGSPMESDVIVGPIYDDNILFSLLNNIMRLQELGYQLLAGGYIQDNNILLPTVLLSSSAGIISTKEMYGPVMCIHIVNDFEDIELEYYQSSSLNTGFFSNDLNEINRFIEYCNTCGTICINCGPDKRDDKVAFGGLFNENDGKEDLDTLIKVLSVEQRIMYDNM